MSAIISSQTEAEALVRRQYPHTVSIEYIEHGYDNLVAIADKQYVFRFPRTEHGVRLLRFEVALLERLTPGITAAAIPHIIYTDETSGFTVSRFIPGTHLTNRSVRRLPEASQAAIGRHIAQFITQLNQAISGDEVAALRKKHGVAIAEPWPVYFARVFGDVLPDEKLRPFIDEWYNKWLGQTAHEQAHYAIHDDLHPANLLFGSGQLRGVLDFGDAARGSIESELRLLYPLGDALFHSVMTAYTDLTGIAIDPQHVRVWAITQDLAAFTERLSKQQPGHPSYLRALGHLRHWLPDFPL